MKTVIAPRASPAHTVSFAHYLGRAVQPAAKEPAVVAKPIASNKVRSGTKSPPRPAAKLASFDHLYRADRTYELEDHQPRPETTAARVSRQAREVHAAYLKSQTPTGTGTPDLPSDPVARKFIQAGRRGEAVMTATGIARPLPPNSLAAKIIQAGRRARGEIA
jgi:hypothetical protein